jgi:hypothetical protein
MTSDEVEELRERIMRKLERLKERDRSAQRAEGWSYDEAHDQMVPPGWFRASG